MNSSQLLQFFKDVNNFQSGIPVSYLIVLFIIAKTSKLTFDDVTSESELPKSVVMRAINFWSNSNQKTIADSKLKHAFIKKEKLREGKVSIGFVSLTEAGSDFLAK